MLRVLAAALAALFVIGNQAPPDPATQRYETLALYQSVDDKCSVLPYADRRLLNDLVLDAMVSLPAIANDPDLDPSTQEYYDRLDQAVAPTSAKIKTGMAAFPCDRATAIFGQVRALAYSRVMALLQLGGQTLLDTMTPQENAIAQSINTNVRTAAAQGSGAELQRAINSEKALIQGDEARSAGRARFLLRQYYITAVLNQYGHALRWDDSKKGWYLHSDTTRRRASDPLFAEPRLLPIYGDDPNNKSYSFRTEGLLVVLPRKYQRQLELVAFAPDMTAELPDLYAQFEVGTGAAGLLTVDYDSETVAGSTLNCIEKARCFRFSGSASDRLRRRVEGRSVSTTEVLIRRDAEVKTKGPADIRRRTNVDAEGKANPPPAYILPLRDMVAERPVAQ